MLQFNEEKWSAWSFWNLDVLGTLGTLSLALKKIDFETRFVRSLVMFCAWKLSSISTLLRVPVCHKSHSAVLASVLKDSMLTWCIAVAACQIFPCTSQDAIKCSRKKIACYVQLLKKTPRCLFWTTEAFQVKQWKIGRVLELGYAKIWWNCRGPFPYAWSRCACSLPGLMYLMLNQKENIPRRKSMHQNQGRRR